MLRVIVWGVVLLGAFGLFHFCYFAWLEAAYRGPNERSLWERYLRIWFEPEANLVWADTMANFSYSKLAWVFGIVLLGLWAQVIYRRFKRR